MKEKSIEKAIINYLRSLWAIVEWQNGWSILIKKWSYHHKMTLQTKGCPDIICFYKNNFYWIEVKKDQKTVDSWTKKEERYKKTWSLPKSYMRELSQIEYKQKILDNWWTHIITCDLQEVMYFIK